MSTNAQRETIIRNAPNKTFLETSETMLKQSGNDTDVTPEEHEQLFAVFNTEAKSRFTNPGPAEEKHIRRIAVSLFSKRNIFATT